MKKIFLFNLMSGLVLLSSSAFAENCKKLEIIKDVHFVADCAFDPNNAGSFEETSTNLKLVVKCYHLSENIFSWNKKQNKQFTYNVKRVNSNSGISTSRDEDDQYYERLETNGNTIKLTTWSARIGKLSSQTSIFRCLQN